MRNFCGSVAESLTSKTNVVFVRFYAEKGGIDSLFTSVFTAMRVLEGPAESCVADVRDLCIVIYSRTFMPLNLPKAALNASISNNEVEKIYYAR